MDSGFGGTKATAMECTGRALTAIEEARQGALRLQEAGAVVR